MKTNDIVYSENPEVVCDGNTAASNGHPRVYLNMEKEGEVICPYCSRKFILTSSKTNA